MKKSVLITVKSKMDDPSGESDDMSFVTEGILSKENDVFVISYEESPLTGLDGTTTTLKVGKDSVVLARHGSVDSMMLFEIGKTHLTEYNTDHGSITLGITAKSLDVNFSDSGGDIKLDYILEYNRSYGGKNSLDVNVRERLN